MIERLRVQLRHGGSMLYIDPAGSIDCEAWVPERPAGAIFHDANAPAPWERYVERNAERSPRLKGAGGRIIERQEPKLGPGCRRGA